LLRRRRVTAANVAGIAILRDQLERHLRATAADPERNLEARLVALRLGDRTDDGEVLSFERRHGFRPHRADDLDALAEHGHALLRLREAIAIGAPLVLVPAGAVTGIEAAVACHVHGRRDLGEEGRLAIAVAVHHLADIDALGIASKGRRDRP